MKNSRTLFVKLIGVYTYIYSNINAICRGIIGIVSVDFESTGQVLIIYSAFVKYLRKNEHKIKQNINYL